MDADGSMFDETEAMYHYDQTQQALVESAAANATETIVNSANLSGIPGVSAESSAADESARSEPHRIEEISQVMVVQSTLCQSEVYVIPAPDNREVQRGWTVQLRRPDGSIMPTKVLVAPTGDQHLAVITANYLKDALDMVDYANQFTVSCRADQSQHPDELDQFTGFPAPTESSRVPASERGNGRDEMMSHSGSEAQTPSWTGTPADREDSDDVSTVVLSSSCPSNSNTPTGDDAPQNDLGSFSSSGKAEVDMPVETPVTASTVDENAAPSPPTVNSPANNSHELVGPEESWETAVPREEATAASSPAPIPIIWSSSPNAYLEASASQPPSPEKGMPGYSHQIRSKIVPAKRAPWHRSLSPLIGSAKGNGGESVEMEAQDNVVTSIDAVTDSSTEMNRGDVMDSLSTDQPAANMDKLSPVSENKSTDWDCATECPSDDNIVFVCDVRKPPVFRRAPPGLWDDVLPKKKKKKRKGTKEMEATATENPPKAAKPSGCCEL